MFIVCSAGLGADRPDLATPHVPSIEIRPGIANAVRSRLEITVIGCRNIHALPLVRENRDADDDRHQDNGDTVRLHR